MLYLHGYSSEFDMGSDFFYRIRILIWTGEVGAFPSFPTLVLARNFSVLVLSA